ncbi:2,' 3'-cyclic nucleotide 2'-phosphodiesterase [Paenibacillus brasilensis]|uniref:Ubiquitin n=1 Tax=Paenibacillus brasilensis TaxID=128574 RepID=A0ABU0L551_9BACL|nr:2,' 3'-cyclic nucleotide 2'-phosphodiesterase [Paenibacillus brasilensis]MDQ0496387.1 ubiquitin [Paenibacillus brasilensis]
MKKWSYLLSGVLIGAVVATAGSAFADQIKSLVGEKVAGEYSVKVNGNSLVENAIVVDGKAHVPLRAVSDSLGAGLKVDGKTIQITTNSNTSSEENVAPVATSTDDSNNKYEQKLLDRKKELEQTITTTQKGIEDQLANLQTAQKSREKVSDERFLSIGDQKIQGYKDQITQLENIIEKSKKEIEEIDKTLSSKK